MKSIKQIVNVIIREYVKVVKKPTFWLTTLLFPVLMGVIMFISASSSMQSEKVFNTDLSQVKKIIIEDNSGILSDAIYQGPLVKSEDTQKSIDLVKSSEAEAFIIYPKDLIGTEEKIQIYSSDPGMLSRTKYNMLATNLLKQNILTHLDDPLLIQVYNTSYNINVVGFKDGVEDPRKPEDLIAPGISVVIYFVLISFATSYLLMSVSEEKENRMMETILTIIRPYELIIGKIFGQVGIIITQVFMLAGLSIVVFLIFKSSIPFDLSSLTINVGQIFISMIYTLLGFFFMAAVMVGVGSAMPNYKDAQSMSGIFVLLSILPIYIISSLITEPTGKIAMITSYFPFTSSIVLMFRNALGELYPWEAVLSILIQVIYVVIAMFLAYKFFEIGSLEYTQKISLNNLISAFKRKKEQL